MQLRREFKSIVGTDFDGATATWDEDIEKVIAVGRMEKDSRPAIKNILAKLDAVDATYENGKYMPTSRMILEKDHTFHSCCRSEGLCSVGVIDETAVPKRGER